ENKGNRRAIMRWRCIAGFDPTLRTGENDAISKPSDVERALTKVRIQKGEEIERASIDGANHFFQGKHDELIDIGEAYVDRRLIDDEEKLRLEAEAAAAKSGSRKPPLPRAMPLKPEDNDPLA
ncbi:MAG: hypothetical protein AAGJ84_16050, partial [Pseudomonadota bacterium]